MSKNTDIVKRNKTIQDHSRSPYSKRCPLSSTCQRGGTYTVVSEEYPHVLRPGMSGMSAQMQPGHPSLSSTSPLRTVFAQAFHWSHANLPTGTDDSGGRPACVPLTNVCLALRVNNYLRCWPCCDRCFGIDGTDVWGNVLPFLCRVHLYDLYVFTVQV